MDQRQDQFPNTPANDDESAAAFRWLPRPVRELFDERLPKGVGWPQVLGSMLLGLIMVQALTGVLLALGYAPSTATAWESVRFIQNQTTLGWLIRGLHHWGATAVIVVAIAHLLRVFFYGAYLSPRRWTWAAGVLLLLTLLAFGLTGYLLPWDLKAYFGTRVATSIPGSLPGIGPYLMKLIRGGGDIGSLTLTRFNAIHVIILPVALAALIMTHLALIRRHGITPPWTDVGEKPQTGRSFFPWQAWRDSLGMLAAVAVVFALVFWRGAPLEDKADPTNMSYVPRPDWYFLWLQQLLRIFQGPLQIVATAIIPGGAVTLLLILPWIDRSRRRRPAARKIALALGALCFFTVVGLTLAGHLALLREEAVVSQRQVVQASAARPTVAPTPIPDLAAQGRQLYAQLRCDGCHAPDRQQVIPGLPPDLAYAGSKMDESWMATYLKDPHPIRWRDDGIRPTLRMPNFELSDQEVKALTAYLAGRTDPKRFQQAANDAQLAKAKPEDGQRLIQQYTCRGCHLIGGEGKQVGPDLTHVGSRLREQYMFVFLRDPKAIIPGTPMKDINLWEEEAAAIAKYLATQK